MPWKLTQDYNSLFRGDVTSSNNNESAIFRWWKSNLKWRMFHRLNDKGDNSLTEITGCPEKRIGSVSSQTFCTNSVAANRTNFFILSKSCRTDEFLHFYFVDIFPTEHVLLCKVRSDWLQLPPAALHINRHRVPSKIRLTMPRVKMSRADRNPWLAKMMWTVMITLVYI